jgi:acetoin utilization protein AcuC
MRASEQALLIVGTAASAPGFGAGHPLSIPRLRTVLALCAALGWLDDRQMRDSPAATELELGRFHSTEYIAALQAADAAGFATIDICERFGIGTRENPVFPGVFARAAATVGGSVRAVELALEGHVVFHPAGGTHHGRPGRASGFCYFNDPVFALRGFAERGLKRILYVDLDAHHCDGVQDAVRDDPRIHTLSIHEAKRWPFTGAVDDFGGGRSRNFPVPRGFNDTELRFLLRAALLPYARALRPQAVVITCGVDGLAGDPLCGLALSNAALWRAVEVLVRTAPAAVVLGGGGYNPWTVARCWTGLWGRLSGRKIPDRLPSAARRILAGLSSELIDDEAVDPRWLCTLADPPHEGPVRAAVTALLGPPAAVTAWG